jgi:hypothetical protein
MVNFHHHYHLLTIIHQIESLKNGSITTTTTAEVFTLIIDILWASNNNLNYIYILELYAIGT